MSGLSFQIFSFFLLISVISAPSFCSKPEDSVNSTFKPTHEWQKVEEGQSIPAGLHVRINLQTGEKEAKLTEDDTNKKSSLIPVNEKEEEDALDPDELKKILKNIRGDDPEADDSVKKKFRSYEELKKEFSELNLMVKTDIEIMTGLVKNFKKFDVLQKDAEDDEILSTLVDLEYLVHQYDNAQEFVKMNGLTDVIYKSLNSTNGDIRSEALMLHGSATQSNPKVQIAAIDSGSINLLLKILAFDEDVNVRSRSLYALSCLIRRFPAAQHKLIKDGGLTVFANIFDEQKEDLTKLQIKLVTLFHDLLIERKDTKINIVEEEEKNSNSSVINDLKERLNQYEKIEFEKKLVEQGWCGRIRNWFVELSCVKDVLEMKRDLHSMLVVNDQHDAVAKTVDALYALSDICITDFQNDKEFFIVLDELRKIYEELSIIVVSIEEEIKQFYSNIATVLKKIQTKFMKNLKDEVVEDESVKDELRENKSVKDGLVKDELIKDEL